MCECEITWVICVLAAVQVGLGSANTYHNPPIIRVAGPSSLLLIITPAAFFRETMCRFVPAQVAVGLEVCPQEGMKETRVRFVGVYDM